MTDSPSAGLWFSRPYDYFYVVTPKGFISHFVNENRLVPQIMKKAEDLDYAGFPKDIINNAEHVMDWEQFIALMRDFEQSLAMFIKNETEEQ